MIDIDGYRPNVGIILANNEGKLFWARRVGQDAWQFPQGGIQGCESPLQALFRELREEVGLFPKDVEVIGCTKGWLRYRLPKKLMRYDSLPICVGQKQVWYLLKLVSHENHLKLYESDKPEFDRWRWIDYWRPIKEVIYFKRHVYKKALHELAPLVSSRVTVSGMLSQSAGLFPFCDF